MGRSGALLDSEVASQSELSEIEKFVDLEIEEAVKYAEESPVPGPSSLREDIYGT